MTDEEYEKEYERLKSELKPFLTEDFLKTLIKAAKTVGWSVDYIEVKSFVQSVFDIADVDWPEGGVWDELEPYQNP